jgi:hypothetical protein
VAVVHRLDVGLELHATGLDLVGGRLGHLRRNGVREGERGCAVGGKNQDTSKKVV